MPNICHELIIGASTEKVYDAITTQAGLSAWWTPDTQATPELNSVARFGFGATYFKKMKISALEPARWVEWACTAGVGEWIGTKISFELQSGNKAALFNSHSELAGQIEQQQDSDYYTVVIFHHDDWAAYTPMFAECNYTWAQFLRSLKLLCETGKGRPWPTQH